MKKVSDIRSSAFLIPVCYTLLLGGLYHAALAWLVGHDWEREDFNYAYLIPAVVAYLIWEKRELLKKTPSIPTWWGMLPILTGIFLFWLGELAGEYFSLYLSLWLLIAGALWLHLGWKKLKIIAFPLFLVLTVFPPPHFIFQKITFTLKLISSTLGVNMMQAFGMSAFREGNVIDLGFIQLQVVDACSGLRYLIPLIVLSLLLAYFFKGAIWKKILLVAFSVPLTLVTNSLRIAMTGVLSEIWGPEVAENFFHGFSGWFIFMFAFAVIVGGMWLLNRMFPEKKMPVHPEVETGETGRTGGSFALAAFSEKPPCPPDNGRAVSKNASLSNVPQTSVASGFRPQLTRFMSFGVLLLLSLVVCQSVDFREKIPAARPFSQFPLALGPWTGDDQVMAKEFIDTLNFTDYALIDYRNPEGQIVSFYVVYYETQAKGQSIHSPATCLPGSGWAFNHAGRTKFFLSQKKSALMEVNRAVMEKSGYRQLAYYWFPMRGRVLTSEYQMKWYTFVDALTRHRTDGALVRLITPIGKNETLEDADARLQAFMGDLVPVLNQFLPQ